MTLSTYEKLAILAKTSPQFKVIQEFVLKLRDVPNEKTCILLCRAEMPKIGDSIQQVFGDIPFVRAMKQMPIIPDEAVIRSLETVIDAMTDGIENAWKIMEESR